MLGGIMDGIAQALTSSLHLKERPLRSRAAGTTTTTRGSGTSRPTCRWSCMPPTTGTPGGAGEFGVAATMAAVACAYARATGTMPTEFPINHDRPARLHAAADRPAHPAVAHRRPVHTRSRSAFVPTIPSSLNGQTVSVDVEDDVRLLWVLRDLLGIHGPKYGCGLEVCKACTSPHQRQGVRPVLGAGRRHQGDRRDHHDRGPARHRRRRCTRCSRRGWTRTCAQCGYCQPGQIMAAVALVKVQKGGDDHRRRLRRDPQHLPLRHVPPHPRGHQGRRRDM